VAQDQIVGINERRRKAPLHFWAKADNAKFVACILFCDPGHGDDTAADSIGYGGRPRIARLEGFYREASIALELIIKAAIAQRIEAGISPQHVTRVRPTHDVLSLWDDAGLPKLSNHDALLLLRVRRTLLWSGRYAAPRDDANHEKDMAQEEVVRGPRGKISIQNLQKPITLDWDNFERLYGIAFNGFSRARAKFDGQFGSME
jgi:hypothetical protein